jgi:hypothetical protein
MAIVSVVATCWSSIPTIWSCNNLLCWIFFLYDEHRTLFCNISISEDIKLCRIIRKLTLKEIALLDNVDTADVEREIRKRIVNWTKEQEETLTDQTGIEPSLSVYDAKQFLEEVISKVKRHKEYDNSMFLCHRIIRFISFLID